MSVLIKGMKMPSVCDECWALDESGDYPMCRITEETRGYNFRVREKRMDRCPLIELPDHGDLVDREAWKKSLIDEGETIGIDGFSIDGLSADDVCYTIENAPAIIPAERSEE